MANTISITEGNAATTPGVKVTSDDPNLATAGGITLTSDDGSSSVQLSGLRDAILAYLQAIIELYR